MKSRRYNLLYAEEDLDHKGFVFVMSRKFDDAYRVFHSHREDFKLKFQRRIDKSSVQIYDLLWERPKDGKNKLWLLGHDSNEFIMDEAVFDDHVKIDEEDTIDQNIKERLSLKFSPPKNITIMLS